MNRKEKMLVPLTICHLVWTALAIVLKGTIAHRISLPPPAVTPEQDKPITKRRLAPNSERVPTSSLMISSVLR